MINCTALVHSALSCGKKASWKAVAVVVATLWFGRCGVVS